MYIRSTKIFMIINKVEMVKTAPIITGMSRVFSEVTISFPSPFHPKIYSTKTAPESSEANHPETAVITGFSAFLIPCLKITLNRDKPLDLAVIM